MTVGVLRAGAIYSVANALSAAVPFVLLPILTRALAPEQYGAVISFFLLVTVSSSIAGLNVHSAVSVKWFDRKDVDFSRYVGAALCVALMSTAVCVALLLGFGILWHERLGLDSSRWPLAALYCGTLVIAGVRTTLWQSQRLPLPSATFQVTAALANGAFSVLGVFVLSLGADGRILGASCAGLVTAVIAVWLLRVSGDATWPPKSADIRKLARFGIPLIPHALAGAVLTSADRFAVAAKLGSEALGVYGAAAQLGIMMSVLGDAMVKTFSPWMYSQMARRSGAGRLRIVGATYALIPVWLVTALVLWLLLNISEAWLLGARYQTAIGLSIWFLLGGAISAVYLNIAGLFFFTSRNEWLSLATVASAALSIWIAPLFVARFGARGGAASYLVTQATLLVLSWTLSMRVQPMPWNRPVLAMRALFRLHRRR